MRFDGEREVPAPRALVWEALHDPEVLHVLLTGCESLIPLDTGTYAATMVARVGPVTDTYRGTFTIDDTRDGHELCVRVTARGRGGRLSLVLRVQLSERPGCTVLVYAAEAAVSGLVSRLSGAALRVAGNHFTACFFRNLAHAVRSSAGRDALAPA